MSWKILLALIILYFLVLVLGALAFHYLEATDTEREEEEREALLTQSREKLRAMIGKLL